MKVGDLVRVLVPELDTHEPYLLHVIEVAKTGVGVIVISGPYIGSEYFLPYQNRQFEVISS